MDETFNSQIKSVICWVRDYNSLTRYDNGSEREWLLEELKLKNKLEE